MFYLLILCSLPSIASSSQNDTLKQGDTLNSNSSSLLVSPNNNFTLGFFTPEKTNGTYLAIQCKACDWSDPVWIGNRETPLPTNSSAALQIDASGRLILTYTEGQRNPFLLSSSLTSLNVTATLLDSGNFVLREVNADGSFGEELWSSFDYPTDTLLPGMKLGVNHRTGRNWSLTSWQDDDIPAAGAFSLEWEPTKRRLVLKNRGVVRWTSGELMNATDFQHITTYYSGFYIGLHTFDYVNISTKEEESFRYAVTPLPDPFLSPEEKIKNRLAGWKLNTLGALYDVVGGKVIIDVGNCYGYENETQQSMGCELWEQPTCRGGGETFEERSGIFYRDTENGRIMVGYDMTPKNSSGSPSDCRENCWSDCDCVAYGSYSEGMCGYWRGTDLQFEQDNTGNTVHLYVLNRPDKGKPRSKTWIWILIPIVVSTVLVVLLLLRRRRRKREEARKEQELKDLLTLEEYSDINELSSGENGSLKVFSYAWVVATTNNFSSFCKLGQGGFGSVYKVLDLIRN
nr:G-type lectin S-receptor-like serine/threonine-protein kinase At1g67520 [Ipomoea batatas]GMD67556.1 G-type lectin S-receptor-like serine/threonine-protein kinase At1g67520 [Ipomoea batatas]